MTPLQTARKRRRRRAVTASTLVLAALATPLLVMQMNIYRRDMAMANEPYPEPPALTSRDRVLIFSPHCDDETLGAGGTIARARQLGAEVRVVFFTNGDGSGSTQIAETVKQRRRVSYPELAKMRQAEVHAAMHEVGLTPEHITFLGYPDSGLRPMWEQFWDQSTLFRSSYTGATRSPYANSLTPDAPYCGSQVLQDLTKIADEFRPTIVMTTHPADTHPDHWAGFAYTAAALEQARLQGQSWAENVKFWTFLVHHHVWPVPHGYHPEAVLAPPAALKDTGTQWLSTQLNEKLRSQKKAALEAYVSQLIFTPHYLRAFVRRNELFGIVPPQGMKSTSAPEQIVIRDQPRDFVLQNFQRAGDILQVAAQPGETGLKLRITLAAPPNGRLSYSITLHQISAHQVRQATIKVHVENNQLIATWNQAKQSQKLAAKTSTNGYEVEIPWKVLSAGSETSLLISSSVEQGSSRLDQTETVVLRLPATF
jgi:LmbE family N-acetylglucosaminyl deacetylase